MRRVALFVEDSAHQKFLGALLQRLADEKDVDIKLIGEMLGADMVRLSRNSGNTLMIFKGNPVRYPDLIVAATDANCKGLRARTRALGDVTGQIDLRIIFAVPDPHIERWLTGRFGRVQAGLRTRLRCAGSEVRACALQKDAC